MHKVILAMTYCLKASVIFRFFLKVIQMPAQLSNDVLHLIICQIINQILKSTQVNVMGITSKKISEVLTLLTHLWHELHATSIQSE